MHALAGRTDPSTSLEPLSKPPVPNELRPVLPEGPPPYLPQPEDETTSGNEVKMGPIGPWASGLGRWNPIHGFTGTRPAVDQYSITRYSPGEWRSRNKEVLEKSCKEQHDASIVDWNARQAMEKTQSEVDKNQEDNTKRLNIRKMEITRWKCELEGAIDAATEEIQLLERERQRIKQASEILLIPESIAAECLARRTSRMDTELIRDEVEELLIEEISLSAQIREIFADTLKKVELQLTEDRTAKKRLEFDWSDKSQALNIDSWCSSLNLSSTTLLSRPGSVMFPDNQSTPDYWQHFTKETLTVAEETRQRSVQLRSTLDAILNNVARDLRTHSDKIEVALSKRVVCTEQATQKFEQELKMILRQLSDVEDLMTALKSALRRMDCPMKKAQTRLDHRLARPRGENCRDESHFGLMEEVKSIGENITVLQAQLNEACRSQECLIQIRNKLEREILLKKKTLEVDKERLSRIREHFPSTNALSGF